MPPHLHPLQHLQPPLQPLKHFSSSGPYPGTIQGGPSFGRDGATTSPRPHRAIGRSPRAHRGKDNGQIGVRSVSTSTETQRRQIQHGGFGFGPWWQGFGDLAEVLVLVVGPTVAISPPSEVSDFQWSKGPGGLDLPEGPRLTVGFCSLSQCHEPERPRWKHQPVTKSHVLVLLGHHPLSLLRGRNTRTVFA